MAQWASIVVSPLVFLANLSLAYALVPVACQTQRITALHLSNGISLALTLVATALTWHALRERVPSQAATKEGDARNQFLSRVGFGVSALMALAVLLQWSAQWLLAPCIA